MAVDIFDETPIAIPKSERAGIVARQFQRAAEQFRDPPGNGSDFAFSHIVTCGEWLIDAREKGLIADRHADLIAIIDGTASPWDCFYTLAAGGMGKLETQKADGTWKEIGKPAGGYMARLNRGHHDLPPMERYAALCERIASIIEADANTTPNPIKCDSSTRSIHIDGKPFIRGLKEEQFAFVQALADAWPERLSFPKIRKTSIHLKKINQNRLMESLPPKLADIIDSNSQGYLLKLPAR